MINILFLRGVCPLTLGAEEIWGPEVGENQDVNIKSHLMAPYSVLSRAMQIALSQSLLITTLWGRHNYARSLDEENEA